MTNTTLPVAMLPWFRSTKMPELEIVYLPNNQWEVRDAECGELLTSSEIEDHSDICETPEEQAKLAKYMILTDYLEEKIVESHEDIAEMFDFFEKAVREDKCVDQACRELARQLPKALRYHAKLYQQIYKLEGRPKSAPPSVDDLKAALDAYKARTGSEEIK